MAADGELPSHGIPAHIDLSPDVFQAISKDLKNKPGDQSAAAKKLDEINFSMKNESQRMLKFHTTLTKDIGCQAGKGYEPMRSIAHGVIDEIQDAGLRTEHQTTWADLEAVTDDFKATFPKLHREKIKELEDDNEKKEKKVQQLMENNDKLQKKVRLLRTERKSLRTDTKIRETKKQSYEGTSYSLQKFLEEKHQEIQNLQEWLQRESGTSQLKLKSLNLEQESFQQELSDVYLKSLKEESTRWISDSRKRDDELELLNTEKENIKFHMKSMLQEKQKLLNDLAELHTKMTDMELELRKTQQENKHLIDCQTASAGTVRSLKTEKEELCSQMECVRQENQTVQNTLCKLKETKTQTESELKKTLEEYQNLMDTLSARDDEVQSFKTEKDKYQQEIKKIQSKLDEQTGKMTEKESQLIKAENENRKLTESLTASADDLQCLKSEKDKIHVQMERLQQEKTHIQRKLDEQKEKMTQTESHLKKAQSENQKLADTLVRKDAEIHNALEECRRLNRKVVVMRLLRSSRSGLGKTMMDMVTKDLTKWLDGRFDSRFVNFSVVHSDSPTDALAGVLFALCLNKTSIATNTQDILQEMKGKRDVYVLVIHHTTKDNLPQLASLGVDRRNNDLQLDDIIDMAFRSDSGLYECNVNKTAVDKIETILKKFLNFY